MKQFILLFIFCTSSYFAFGQEYQTYWNDANEAFKNGNYDKAIKDYRSYLVLGGSQNDEFITKAENCKTLRSNADVLFDAGNYPEAAAKYQELLNINPSDRHANDRKNSCIAEINPSKAKDNPFPSVGTGIDRRRVAGRNKSNAINTANSQSNTITTAVTPPPLKKFHFGMVGFGASVSNIETNSWLYEEEKNPRLVAFLCYPVDLIFEYKLARFLSFQPELQFVMKGAPGKAHKSDLYYDTRTGDYLSDVLVEDTLNLNYLQLPLNLVFNIPVSKTTDLFFGAGYYLAYGVSGKLKLSPSKAGYSFDEEEAEDVFSSGSDILKLNRFDRGINCMLGFRRYFDDGSGSFFIRAGYEWSLDNISVSRGRSAETFKNNCFSISMGVFL